MKPLVEQGFEAEEALRSMAAWQGCQSPECRGLGGRGWAGCLYCPQWSLLSLIRARV